MANNQKENKRILITGGAGFIGSHLVELLLANGCFVRVVDNFSTGKMENLPTGNPDLEVQTGDIRNKDDVAKAVKNMDAVVHLAAVASVQASVVDPIGTHSSNFLGTLNLLERCREEQVKRFIYASSAAVYGDVKTLPVPEETPLNPLTPYASDKLAGEYYLEFYRREYGLEPGVFRFFNVFGPRQDPSSPYSGVISIFVDRALTSQDLTIYGDGEQTRDFIYVKDLVTILYKALITENLNPGPVNAGTGTQTSLNQLIKVLETTLKKELIVRYSAHRLADIKNSLADISRLQTRFNFTPSTTFSAGLKCLIDFSKYPDDNSS